MLHVASVDEFGNHDASVVIVIVTYALMSCVEVSKEVDGVFFPE